MKDSVMKNFRKHPTFALRLLPLLALLGVQLLKAQTKAERIDSLMNENFGNGVLNGIVLVAESGRIVYEKAFGYADMEWNVPNEIRTKSNLASVTKQFVAMLVLQQVEKGTMKLDSKITDYLSDYPAATGRKITIHQLLNHTSGIPNFTELPEVDQVFSRSSYPTPASFLSAFADSALQFEPGSKFSYNNSAYFLLGVILEKVTGMPFAQLLQKNILDPLGMKETGMDDQVTLVPKRAAGYNRGILANTHAGYWDRSSLYTAGGMYSTVGDLFLWDQALYTDKLLPAKYRDLLFTSSIAVDSETRYGYGWFLKRVALNGGHDSIDVTYHTGTITGFNALMYRVPATRRTFICLSNMLVGRDYLIAMAKGCMNILYDRPYDHPKKSVAVRVGSELVSIGIRQAVKAFEDLRVRPEMYALNEEEINTLGYEVLRQRTAAEAVEIFKLNVAAFPNSSNAYDSLGDAYAKDGNISLAMENYRRAVEIDSSNIASAEKLRKLRSR
jgi:CubicO group peptidase (beta-lactamase class C family)